MHQRKPTLNDMFDYIATLYPERIAIRDKAESISYIELLNRANRIANYLVSMLSGSEHEKNRTPIAIYLPSSIDFVCAKLAILKAGYPYLPLDLKYPADRIQAILQQTHTAIILTTTIQSNAFPEGNWELLTLDVPELFASYSSEIPKPQNKPEDLAYIIFTSGSTGIPKGASIRHENVLNAVYWTHDFFSMQPGEIGAQLTRVVFDASVWEFWANLLIGNTIVIVPEHMMLDPLELRKAIVNDAIEYIFLPTPIGEMIIQEELLPGSKLKWAWVGGDRLLQRPIPKFSAKVANIYGPTECTIVSTCEIVEPDVSTDPPPIGDPIANAEIYILDENLKVLPPNTKGEICIAGAGVGSGYYNAPQLSNPVFIPNPFSDKAGDILYRSGDLGIYNSNGKLECLGRIDYQVKIRGYRIELGEIEAVLNSLPEIQNVIVLAEGDSNEKELIAFYTTNNSVAMPDSELQAIAESKLPDYMIPHTYIFISEFPLTANGKIDRRALVRMLIPKESQQIGELPTTDFEQSIAGIWSQVLKTSSISLSDRFYQLGGHSIKAAQMIGIIRTKLNLEISIGNLLSNPSLKEFCATISLLKPTDKTTIPVHEKKDAYPLAFDQQGLWYYWRLQPKRRDYIVCMRFDLLGFVNPDILKSAIEFLQERHPIMRCGFRTVQGKPEQYFRDTQELSFTFIKLKQPNKIEKNAASGDSEPVFEHQQLFPYPYETEELLAIETSMRLTPFNLDKDPLYRIALVQFDEQHFCMFLSIHHIITDGWSVGLWQKELRQVYTALLNGKQPNLSPVGITYGDYTLWQLAEKPAQRYPEQQQYWKQRLTPLPTPVHLPLRLTPISEEFPAGKRVWWKLNKQLSQQLRDISQKSGNSLFATMLCLFKVLVLQYNGQEDSTILSIYAGRNLPQTKNLLGLLTNLFFVRSSLNSDNSLSTQIALENRHCAEAMQNIDYPFEQLLQDLFPKHDKHSEAIARVIFIMQNYPMEAADNAPFELSMKEIGSDASKFDLLFTVEDDAEELLCWFEYRTRLYEDNLILRLAKQYTKLCETYCQAPELPIKELQIILPQEMQHLLYELNDTGKDYPTNTCYPALWQQNLSLYAKHIAVVCPEGDFSYEELENRSNQLANYLISSGVNHGDIIGICLPRGIWLATAMLAIWKVGAAYLPLDTKYPLQRLSFMLSDAKLRIILGDKKAAEAFSSLCSPKQDCRFVSLELLSESILSLPSAKLPCPADGDSTAYVIYTSGSTGTPKGVLISHKNLINHNFAVIDAFQLNSDDRVLQFGAISFDLSAEEIFPTWLAGATLVFRRDDTQDSVDNFLGLVEEQKISVIDLPTAFWHAIVTDLNKRPAPANLRLCIIGGERALPEKLRLWQDFSQGKIRLLNTYGPTETTIIATLHDATNDAYSEFFPIGKPISNLKAYILNPQQKLMPLGATGELYLGGAGVGKGYLNLPELTSQRFMSNPFINNSSERLYRTGDLVAYSETGELHYVGRADDQVKLLGHRIELGEIAAKLRQHPQVLDAVVILRSESIDHQYLCAYTICTGTPPSGSDLRKHLLQSLPDYMVPAYYANLSQFPLTVHGKIDLKALPEPDQATPVKLQEFVHFYTPEQEVLCRAIAEILQLEQVSIKDNFFELGGNSILSMQLIQKLRHAGLQLGVEQLFRCEDVEELAASLILQSVEDNAFGEFCLVELKKGNPDKTPLIFVHSLPGDVLGYVNLIPKLSADLPVYGLQALGLIDPDKTHISIEEMAKYYLQILKSQRFEHGFSLAGWCFGGRVAVEMALIMRQTSTKVPRVFLFETYAYNPVPSLKLAYKLHRAKQIAKNWKRMPHLLKVKIKDQKGYQTQFTAKEVFQDQGIFKNRSLVRKANVQAIYSCPLKRYPWELILFKARVQHPDMIHDSSLGWKVFAPNITIHEVEATHENILKDPNVEQIAKLMNEYLK